MRHDYSLCFGIGRKTCRHDGALVSSFITIKGSKMQLVDESWCDRCGKYTKIVRLIPADINPAMPTVYICLCRTCLAYSWDSLDSGKFPDRDLHKASN